MSNDSIDEKKVGGYGDAHQRRSSVKGSIDVETVPIYDDQGPVEFEEKKELRSAAGTMHDRCE